MSIAEIQQVTEKKMQQSIEALKQSLSHIRTGRANASLLDVVQVDYYGSLVPLNQVANISVLDARTLSVQAWEKALTAKVEKAIRESDLGLNPSPVGDLIRVPLPMMTEERRKELTKVVRHEGENTKIAIRNLRRDANDSVKRLEKDKVISEDEQKRSESVVQKATDKFIIEIDKIVEQKEKEIMSV